MKVFFNKVQDFPVNKSFPFCFHKEFTTYLNNRNKEHLFFYDKKYDALCVAELYKIKFLKVLRFHFPPLTKDAETLSLIDEKNYLNRLINFINQGNIADRILQPFNYCVFQSYPDNAVYAPFGTYKVNLQKSNDDLMADMQADYRTQIRSIMKSQNWKILDGIQQIPVFHKIYSEMNYRKGLHTESLQEITDLYNTLGEDMALCRVIYWNDVPEAALMLIYTEYASYYLFGCSVQKPSKMGITKFLHYDTMLKLKEKNVKYYDFVGARLRDLSNTPYLGIQQFKERFGAELKKGYLWKLDINKTKCKMFDSVLMLKNFIQRKNKISDIIDQEIMFFNKS
jgi:hypothetical protein